MSNKLLNDIKLRIFDLIFSNISFPKYRMSGLESQWMLKDNCPCCISNPIESLSNAQYRKKYPANNVITLGGVNIYLCDYHLKELKNEINCYIEHAYDEENDI